MRKKGDVSLSAFLRASKIGFPCARNLWYSANSYESKTSERSQRIFDVGNALEPVIVNWLRNDGWIVDYNPGSQNAHIEYIVPVKNGELRGHPDAFISKGEKQNILIDIKTMNDRAFKFWERQGTLTKYPQYAEQLHVYAMGAKLNGIKIDGLGVVGVNKNSSQLWIDFFEFNPNIADLIVKRAQNIFAMDTPPEVNCPSETWACKYCDFSNCCNLCDNCRKSSKTVSSNVVDISDAEIIDAMHLLQDARQMAKDARELEKIAKDILNEKVRNQGLKNVKGDGFILTIKESSSLNFDSDAFKKAHPELFYDFMKEVSKVTYSLKEV